MNNLNALPTYPDEDLAELSSVELIDTLIENEDRVPRNVIDECVRRGDEITNYLRTLHEDDFLWQLDGSDGEWWLRYHCEDRNLDWFIRVNAIDPIMAALSRQGGEALEQALAWLGTLAADEDEDWEFRLVAASMLLNFPRDQYRQLLEELEARQSGWGKHFDMQSIEQAYAGQYYPPEWERFTDPWKFYEPEAITKRQIRWREEDEKERLRSLNRTPNYPANPYDPYYLQEPYVRPEPKVGRNDPCPCGSGKKYKKCCLAKE
jgi:hypothetical protein